MEFAGASGWFFLVLELQIKRNLRKLRISVSQSGCCMMLLCNYVCIHIFPSCCMCVCMCVYRSIFTGRDILKSSSTDTR